MTDDRTIFFYRGSMGNGQKGIFALTKHVGDFDVKDCFQAVQECLKKYANIDVNKLILYGGSHGGFLVTHLAGQYPDAFKAVVGE